MELFICLTVVSSAPADLASETNSAVAADSIPSSTSPSSYSEQQAAGQSQGDDVPSSTYVSRLLYFSRHQLISWTFGTKLLQFDFYWWCLNFMCRSNGTQSVRTLTSESDTFDVSSTTTFSSDVNASPVIDNVSDLNSNNAQLSRLVTKGEYGAILFW